MILTPTDLTRRYLRDVPLTDSKGRPMRDEDVQAFIQTAVRAFERKHGVLLTRRHVRLGTKPLRGAPAPDPDSPVIVKDALDFDPRAFEGNRHAAIRLPLGPVVQVHAVGLQLPGRADPIEFKTDWVQVKARRRTIQIYPGSNVAYTPFAQTGLALYALNSGRTVPNAWQVSYTAGYSADDLNGQDADVKAAIAKMAALEILVPGSIDQHLAAGVSGRSVSVDGLSQSTQLLQNAQRLKFGALIDAYTAELQSWERTYEMRRTGIRMGVL